MPVFIVVGNGIYQVPRPPGAHANFRRYGKTGRSLAGRGLAGIFSLPHMGGRNYWLIISWRWSDNAVDVGSHTPTLMNEPKCWEVVWLSPDIHCSAMWTRGGMRLFSARLSKATIACAFVHFGDPYKEAAWLAGKLMPRLCPGCLRLVNSLHSQLWIDL